MKENSCLTVQNWSKSRHLKLLHFLNYIYTYQALSRALSLRFPLLVQDERTFTNWTTSTIWRVDCTFGTVEYGTSRLWTLDTSTITLTRDTFVELRTERLTILVSNAFNRAFCNEKKKYCKKGIKGKMQQIICQRSFQFKYVHRTVRKDSIFKWNIIWNESQRLHGDLFIFQINLRQHCTTNFCANIFENKKLWNWLHKIQKPCPLKNWSNKAS